jgi:hypothetical protein
VRKSSGPTVTATTEATRQELEDITCRLESLVLYQSRDIVVPVLAAFVIDVR